MLEALLGSTDGAHSGTVDGDQLGPLKGPVLRDVLGSEEGTELGDPSMVLKSGQATAIQCGLC